MGQFSLFKKGIVQVQPDGLSTVKEVFSLIQTDKKNL
jgi:hypothetical protein